MRAEVILTEADNGDMRNCSGGAHRGTNPIFHAEGSSASRNVQTGFCFGDSVLSAQRQP